MSLQREQQQLDSRKSRSHDLCVVGPLATEDEGLNFEDD